MDLRAEASSCFASSNRRWSFVACFASCFSMKSRTRLTVAREQERPFFKSKTKRESFIAHSPNVVGVSECLRMKSSICS